MYIYLDESGDLGFDFDQSGTSEKFVITLLVCHDRGSQKAIRKAIRRTLKRINCSKGKTRYVQELKGTQTIFAYKKYFFDQIKNENWSIYGVVLNKRRVSKHLQTTTGKNKLYNFLARYLLEKLPLRTIMTNVRLIVDRSKNKDQIRDFNQSVQNQIQGLLPLNTGFGVEHLNSEEDYGLQAVDLFCWGVFRKYERQSDDWYKVFQSRIKFEQEYLGGCGA